MKKLLLGLILTVSVNFAQAQKTENVKIELPLQDGKILYESIIELPGVGKSDVYGASIKWMSTAFVDSKEVIQLQDKDLGSIIGKGYFTIFVPGFVGSTYNVQFVVDIATRDNKSRIRLKEFQEKVVDKYGEVFFRDFDELYSKYLKELQYPKQDRKLYASFKEQCERIISDYKSSIKSTIQDKF